MTQVHHSARAAFFGDAPRELFGCVHLARGDTVRDIGVVLCYPAPQEYRMVHWAFHHLAEVLSANGFPVLRFDYYGTGDSAGGSADGSLAQWETDIGTAVEHLRAESDARRVCLVGMRLGAALATRAVAGGVACRDLVLWDPVVDGREYVRELERADARVRADQPYPVPSELVDGELLGYPFSAALRADVASIDLLVQNLPRPRRLHVLTPTSSAAHEALAERARQHGVLSTHQVVNDPALYWQRSDPVDTLVAHAGIQAVLAFLLDGHR